MPEEAPTIHVIATQHLDVAWLWKRRPEGEQLMRQCFRRAIEMIEADPDRAHVHSRSTAWGFHIVEQRWPALFEKVRRYVESGHIELCGGQWVEPDNILPDGEAMLRQCLVGQTYYRKTFGKTATVAWNPDVFCHGNTLPQLFARTGLDGYYFHRCRPLDAAGNPLYQFVWEAPDGSRVLCFTGRWEYGPDARAVGEADAVLAETGLPADYMATGRNSDRRITMDRGWLDDLRVAAESSDATLRWSTADDVLQHMRQYADRLPVVRGHLGGYSFTGTYTSDGITKRYNRKLENDLYDAEWLSVAAANGPAVPAAALTGCWRDLCVNHFHDIACGTCYRDVQEEAHALYRSIEERTDRVLGDALSRLNAAARTDAQPGWPVVVHNTLSFPRREPVTVPVRTPAAARVRDAAGNVLPCQPVAEGEGAVVFVPREPVPGMAHAVYYLDADGGPPAKTAPDGGEWVLENDHLRCELDSDTGAFRSLIDRATGRECIRPGGRGNRLEFWEDRNDYAHAPDHRWDPWFVRYTGRVFDPVGAWWVDVVEDGPVRKVVRVRRRLSLHPDLPDTEVVQDLVLYRDLPLLYVHCRGDWQAKECMLKAAFDLARPAETVVVDMPYGVEVRAPDYVAASAVDAGAAAEDRVRRGDERDEPDRPLQKWLTIGDADGGLAILNNGKYGYDSTRETVRLSLMRAPMIRDGEVAGLGPFAFSYAILPHTGDWRAADLVRQGLAFNRPLRAGREERHGGAPAASRLAVDAPNVLVTAVKRAELDDRLVVRLYEASGQATACELRVGVPFASAVEGSALEEPLPDAPPLEVRDGGGIPLSMGPFEVKTLLLSPRSATG